MSKVELGRKVEIEKVVLVSSWYSLFYYVIN